MPVDINSDQFEQAVIQRSRKVPVLVDFWAAWCGPCRVLGPVLEKVEADLGGKFELVKVDTEKNQDLAGRFQISGIPACKLFFGGEIIGEFTGALPEPQILRFLEEHIPDPKLQNWQAMADRGEAREAATQILAEENPVTKKAPQEIVWQAACQDMATLAALLEKNGRSGEADFREVLTRIHTWLDGLADQLGSPLTDQKTRLKKVLEPWSAPERLARAGEEERGELLAYLRLCEPVEALSTDRIRESLDFFLSQLSQADKKEQGKEGLLAAFALLGEQNSLVAEYRRKMAGLLFV